MPDTTISYRVSQRQAHVLLPEHLFEALRAETTVKRLVRNGILFARVGHGRSLSGGADAIARHISAGGVPLVVRIDVGAVPVIGATARFATAHDLTR